jgi:hypothetical protein
MGGSARRTFTSSSFAAYLEQELLQVANEAVGGWEDARSDQQEPEALHLVLTVKAPKGSLMRLIKGITRQCRPCKGARTGTGCW